MAPRSIGEGDTWRLQRDSFTSRACLTLADRGHCRHTALETLPSGSRLFVWCRCSLRLLRTIQRWLSWVHRPAHVHIVAHGTLHSREGCLTCPKPTARLDSLINDRITDV